MHIKQLSYAIALSASLVVTPAQAIPVFDAANFSQNLRHYLDLITNTIIEQGLLDDQLVEMVESVALAQQQLDQVILAARQLDRLDGYVDDRDLQAIYNTTQGIFARLQRLNPSNQGYSNQVNNEIITEFNIPEVLPPYEYMVGSTSAVDNLSGSYESLIRSQEQLGTRVRSSSAAGQLSLDRQQQIEQYRLELEELGNRENPALATSQLDTKQSNLILLQNEQIIERMDREERRQLEEEAEEIAARAEIENLRRRALIEKTRRETFGPGTTP